MPKYEFRCPVCELAIEQDSTAVPECHLCDDVEPVIMKRVYSIAGISFRGTGFYKTDSRGTAD